MPWELDNWYFPPPLYRGIQAVGSGQSLQKLQNATCKDFRGGWCQSQSTGQAQAEREVGYLGPQACARHVLLVLPKWPPPGCPALAPVDGVSEPFPTPSGPGYHRANHSLYASERLGWSLPSAWVGMVPTQTPVTGLFARRWWGCASPISRQLGERPLWSPSSTLGGIGGHETWQG